MDDKRLVMEFLHGNEEAFDELYKKYSQMLYRSAFLICQNEADAQDILQDTFITFYHKAKSIRKPESLKFWLLKCVTLRSRDLLRRRKPEILDEHICQTVESGSEDLPDTFDEIVFMECIKALPPKYREVLVLYYYVELSVTEIATVTGQLTGTVKSRLFYARAKLKQLLEGGHRCR